MALCPRGAQEKLQKTPNLGGKVLLLIFLEEVVETKKWYRRKADLWAELSDEYHSAGKKLLKGIGKGRLRSAMRHRSTEGLFALLKGKFSGMCGDMARCKERTS
jgi:hypothetical protein